MADKKILTEYEAAVATGMSPELLRWLTKNPPKQGLSRVLKVEKIDNGLLLRRGRTPWFQQLAESSMAS
jgi:hypothetical protein